MPLPRTVSSSSKHLSPSDAEPEQLSHEKNGEESNETIRRLTAELQAIRDELDSFSYSVSHDLRAPLRHITGYAELLQLALGAELKDKPRHFLDEIIGSAEQMQKLLEDLLEISRIGRVEMHLKNADLNVLAQDAIGRLKSQIADRNITWKIGHLPTVRGDTSLLTQVFIHLFSNAIKFTRTRDPAEIEIGSMDVSGGEKTIFVRDNGVGFDTKFAGKLFGVFQRLHTTEEFEGAGTGLARVRRIIGRHGGRAWAEGMVGQGATFYFSLPAAPA